MTIEAGQTIPLVNLQRIRNDQVEEVSTSELFDGRKVVLFAVPGAFTPTCSEAHLPGYIQHMDEFRALGVDVIGIAVNDAYVMDAWAKIQAAPDDLQLLADGNAVFTRELGLERDASAYGMGLRSKRFALYVVDGVVEAVNVEAPGEFRVSSAEYLLDQLRDKEKHQ